VNKSDNSSQCSAKLSKLEASFRSLADKLKEVCHSKSLTESKSVTELFQIALDKARMSATTLFTELGPGKGFRCDLSADFVFISSGEAQNKRLAKHSAYTSATELLRTPYLRVVEDARSGVSNLRLVTSHDPFVGDQQPDATGRNTAAHLPPRDSVVNLPTDKDQTHYKGGKCVQSGKKRSSDCLYGTSLKDFVILQPNTMETNAVNILQQSADFNKWLLEYDVSDMGGRCRVTLGGHVLSDVTGDSRSTAKMAAAEQALKRLSSTSCTVCVKMLTDEELDDTLKRSEVICNSATICCSSIISGPIACLMLWLSVK